MTTRRTVTSSDVAKLAGVSRATVSYVLNGSEEKISKNTQTKVLDAAKKLNYRPSAIARQLRSGVGEHILICTPSLIVGPTYPKIFAAMGELAFEQGLALTLQSDKRDQVTMLEQSLQFLNPRYVASLQQWSEQAKAEIERFGAEAVSLDVEELVRSAARRQWEYLYERGARSIAYVLLDSSVPEFLWRPRVDELDSLCAAHDMNRPLVLHMPSKKNEITEFASKLLESQTSVDGICGHTDEVLLALFAALDTTTEKVRIPLIGLSNLPGSKVGLTTVDIVPEEWAAWWMDKILNPKTDERPGRPALQIIRRDT